MQISSEVFSPPPTHIQVLLAPFATWGRQIEIAVKGLYYQESGLATCAFLIHDQESGGFIDRDYNGCPAPNHTISEYIAILAALECVNRDHHMAHARILSSNKSIVDQINQKSYTNITRKRMLLPLLQTIRCLLDETGARIEYAAREKTNGAKKLARMARTAIEMGVAF